MVGEGIPQSRRSHLEGPISHSAEFGLGDLEFVAIRGTEMSGWVLPIDEVLEVHCRGHTDRSGDISYTQS